MEYDHQTVALKLEHSLHALSPNRNQGRKMKLPVQLVFNRLAFECLLIDRFHMYSST